LTNAAWAKTNVTAAKTATGIDNAPNSASTLTAGAADATILQTLSLAAAARSFSAYVKRRTGSGNIYITRDGGTSWTDVTSQINSSTWTRVKIENTSVLNPSCGFKIATSGDAIDVDVCQDEAGAYITSPIVTTSATVTRNADALSYPVASNFSNTAGTVLVTATPYGGDVQLVGVGGGGELLFRNSSPKVARTSDGTTSVSTVGNFLDSTTKNAAVSFATSGTKRVVLSGGAVASNAYDGNYGNTALYMGSNSGTTSEGRYMKNVYIWQTALTDAQLQQVTA
jgi:hypothetical protein